MIRPPIVARRALALWLPLLVVLAVVGCGQPRTTPVAGCWAEPLVTLVGGNQRLRIHGPFAHLVEDASVFDVDVVLRGGSVTAPFQPVAVRLATGTHAPSEDPRLWRLELTTSDGATRGCEIVGWHALDTAPGTPDDTALPIEHVVDPTIARGSQAIERGLDIAKRPIVVIGEITLGVLIIAAILSPQILISIATTHPR